MSDATLSWRSKILHSLVGAIRVEFVAGPGPGKKAFLPRCQIEVCVEDRDCVDIAFCNGLIDYGSPASKLVWLGSRGKQPIHEKARGKACINGGDGRERTVAQAVCSLFAEITRRFGATQVELIADDDGSGRLVKYYEDMGFEGRTNFHDHVWFMVGPAKPIAALAPASWIAVLRPDLDYERWLGQFFQQAAEPQIFSAVAAHKQYRRLQCCGVPDAVALGALSQTQRDRSSKPLPDIELARTQTAPAATSRQVETKILSPKLQKSERVGEHIPQLVLSPIKAVLALEDGSSVGVESRSYLSPSLPLSLRSDLQDLHRKLLPELPLSPASADTWGWKVAWPLDARIDIRVKTIKGKHRIDAWLRSLSGEELAYTRAGIPPAKGFLKIFWLGREHGQPVHPSVRGKQVYETEQDDSGGALSGSVTVAISLLGVIAALAYWLEVDLAELEHFDDGSGKLVKYLNKFGFEEAAETNDDNDAEASGRLTASCADLVQRCLPTAWVAHWPPNKLSPSSRLFGR